MTAPVWLSARLVAEDRMLGMVTERSVLRWRGQKGFPTDAARVEPSLERSAGYEVYYDFAAVKPWLIETGRWDSEVDLPDVHRGRQVSLELGVAL